MKKVFDMTTKDNNDYNGIGDFVHCAECESVMLTDIGVDDCPICGVQDCLMWEDEENKEMTIEQIKQLGYDVE